MSQETFIESKNPASTQIGDVVAKKESDFRLDNEDNISQQENFTNFVDAATFMACQEGRGKMHPASPDKD